MLRVALSLDRFPCWLTLTHRWLVFRIPSSQMDLKAQAAERKRLQEEDFRQQWRLQNELLAQEDKDEKVAARQRNKEVAEILKRQAVRCHCLLRFVFVVRWRLFVIIVIVVGGLSVRMANMAAVWTATGGGEEAQRASGQGVPGCPGSKAPQGRGG